MTLNTQKEDFSLAYINAVTSSVGYSLQTATRRLDDSGIDAKITVPGKINSKRLPRFDVQIKSTSQDSLKDELIKYRLKAKNYNELRSEDLRNNLGKVETPKQLILIINLRIITQILRNKLV